ncbi:MAG: hypothetical protein EOO55_00805 [Hymenobacter sp.]|nr:MAG: hypothetical protein EOO55_00805 [Hymenobacter sp.]
MNYLCYKDAFSALIEENDGVLPDLYEEVDITISCHPADAPALATVADVVAYAIIETSTEFYAATASYPVLLPPPSAHIGSKPNGLACLLTQAATSCN